MGHLVGQGPEGIVTAQSPIPPFSQPTLPGTNLVPDAVLFLLPVILIFALMFGLCCTFWCYVLRATRRIEAELSGSSRHFVAKCDGMEKMTYKKKWLKKASLKSDACAICLEDFKNKVEINLCVCGHAYHHKCIIRWMEIKDTCPICQRCVREKNTEIPESQETAPLLGVEVNI